MNHRGIEHRDGDHAHEPESGGAVVIVEYDGEVDGLVVSGADTSDLDIFEPLDDLEVTFDATELGRLLGIRVCGARLRKPGAWRQAMATLCGPTLWSAYEMLALEDDFHVRQSGEAIERRFPLEIPGQEWTTLWGQTWRHLHRSLLRAEGWEEPPSALSPTAEDVDEQPWLIATRLRPHGEGDGVHLPASLAAKCGVHPLGYVYDTGRTLVVRFDILERAERSGLELELAGPYQAAGDVCVVDDELVISFPPSGHRTGNELMLVLAQAHQPALVPPPPTGGGEA